MATPTTFSVPDLEPAALIKALGASKQYEPTPPPEFANADATQDYHYICEVERGKYSTCKVEQLRAPITQPAYWKAEAQRYKEELSDTIEKRLVSEYSHQYKSEADLWKRISKAYKERLRRRGVTAEQIRKSRLSIRDQAYWEPEAERLRAASAAAEYRLQQLRLERHSGGARTTYSPKYVRRTSQKVRKGCRAGERAAVTATNGRNRALRPRSRG